MKQHDFPSNEELQVALRSIVEARWSIVESMEPKEVHFSPEFEKRMQFLFENYNAIRCGEIPANEVSNLAKQFAKEMLTKDTSPEAK